MLIILKLVGFGRACAPVRCAHPSFWAHYHPKRGAARPSPAHGSFSAFYSSPKNNYFKKQIGSLLAQSFRWAKLHPTGLHCILLSYAAPSWATLNPNKLYCALLSYATPYYAMLHSTELHCTLSELCCFPELRCTLWAKLHPTELRCTLLNYTEPYLSYAGL